jgi:ribosomal protein L14E/L6E/L27E
MPAYEDPYVVLGLPRGASKDEIKERYKMLAKIYHPDISKNVATTEQFNRVTSAYAQLTGEKFTPFTLNANNNEANKKRLPPETTAIQPVMSKTELSKDLRKEAFKQEMAKRFVRSMNAVGDQSKRIDVALNHNERITPFFGPPRKRPRSKSNYD